MIVQVQAMGESVNESQYTIDPSAYLQYKEEQRVREKTNIAHEFRVLVEGLAKGTAAKIDLVHHGASRLVTVLKVFKQLKDREAEVEQTILNTVSVSPFLIQCYDAFVFQGHHCLVLQYAPFGNLDQLTRTLKGLGSDTMRVYAKEIAQSLDFLHSRNIIHRDVKPENMLILTSGHVVLADFNIAFQANSEAPTSTQTCGTFLTRPPEVWDRTPYNQAVDVWMYGVSLYNIASNKWPFLHARRDTQMEAVRAGGCVKFDHTFFSPDLIDLIQQTLRVDSSRRISIGQILHHAYFQDVDQSQGVPLSPSQLLSLVVKSPVEREIIHEILKDNQNPNATDPT